MNRRTDAQIQSLAWATILRSIKLYPENHFLPSHKQLHISWNPFPGFSFFHTLPHQVKRLHTCGCSHSAAYGLPFGSDPLSIDAKAYNSVSCQLRHSLETKQPLPVCSGQQRTQFSHIWSPVTRHSRVHVVLKGQDDRVERCFKSTFCNGLDCILKEREWSQRWDQQSLIAYPSPH